MFNKNTSTGLSAEQCARVAVHKLCEIKEKLFQMTLNELKPKTTELIQLVVRTVDLALLIAVDVKAINFSSLFCACDPWTLVVELKRYPLG